MNRLALLLTGLVVAELAAAAPGASDLMVRAPLPVTYPAAGATFVDPSFGTTVARITDARSGARCVHAYSYWPAMNATSTRVLLACDDVPLLFGFDPATGRSWPDGRLAGADGAPLQFEGATWSHGLEGTIYALDRAGSRLFRVNVAKRGSSGYTLLRNFAGELAPLVQMTVSEGAGVFAFTERAPTGAEAVVWRRSDARVFRFARLPGETVNEVQIGKDGVHAIVHLDSGAAYLWTPATGASSALPNTTGHWDMGRTLAVNGDGVLTGAEVRGYSLAAALAPRNVFRYLRADGRTPNWTIAEHVSMRADDEGAFALSTYAGGAAVDQPFEDEVVIVRADGSGFRRLAHTRSAEREATTALRYYAQPRAVIDASGRWIVWTSDLGTATRFDVLAVRVP